MPRQLCRDPSQGRTEPPRSTGCSLLGKGPRCGPFWRHGCTKSTVDTGAWASSCPEQGPLLRPSPSCLGDGQVQPSQEQLNAGPISEAQGARKSLGVLRDARPGLRALGENGWRGLPGVPPSVGRGRGEQHRLPLTSPVARRLCPLRLVLPAELTPPPAPPLCSGISSHPIGIFTPGPGKGLALWGGGRDGWAATLCFQNWTSTWAWDPQRVPTHPSHGPGPGGLGQLALGRPPGSRC